MIIEQACAKINLALHVLGRRLDGYHDLDSLVIFADCGDVVQIAPAGQFALTVEGPFREHVPIESENIIIKAWATLQSIMIERDISPSPLAVKLIKNLPVASGIGGGSADAAAFLRAALRLFNFQLTPDHITALAKNLGADVPVCFLQKPCRMQGIGEIITDISVALPRAIVLVNPGQPCSTAAVFSKLNLAVGQKHESDIDIHNDQQWRNDLTVAAVKVQPLVADVLAALQQEPCFTSVRMSGSGATCFGLAKNMADASAAAARLSVKNPNWWIKAAQVL